MIMGFLDRDGNYYFCDSYGHLDLAYELVEKMGKITPIMSKLDAEDLLRDMGWIIFSARHVYMKLSCSISKAQKYALLDFIDFYKDNPTVPIEKIEDAKRLVNNWRVEEETC